MKRLLLLTALAAPSAFSQLPAAPPPPNTSQPGATAPAPTSVSTMSSRISRVIAGPDGRAQGLLLRNGTFVSLSPGLSQQIPAGIRRSASVSVSGPAYGMGSDRTIQAQQITIAGVAYNDLAGVGPGAPPPPAPAAAPFPPAPAGPMPPPPPRGPGAPPPPPPPCASGPVPPPPGGPAAAPAPPGAPAALSPVPPPPGGPAAVPAPPAGEPQPPVPPQAQQ